MQAAVIWHALVAASFCKILDQRAGARVVLLHAHERCHAVPGGLRSAKVDRSTELSFMHSEV